MIPSKTWFPQSLAERAAWMQNFTTELARVGPNLNIGASRIGQAQEDNTYFQWVAQMSATVESYQRSFIAYRKHVCEAANGTVGPDLPLPPVYPATVPFAPAGLFERLDMLVRQIRASDAYTPEDGIALGIVPRPQPEPEPAELKPVIKLSAAPGNIVVIDFVRGKTDGIDVQMQLDGSEAWENGGKFIKSPGELLVPQGTLAAPRAVRLRARFLDGNTPVGQYSDIAQVSTIS